MNDFESTDADTAAVNPTGEADLLDDEPDLAVESWLVDTQALLHAALADIVVADGDAPDEATLTYLSRQYLHRVGDPVRLRVGDSALSGTDLAVRLVRLLIDDLTESEGTPPAQTVLAYPARWGRFRVEVLTRALEAGGIAPATATPAPDAVAVGFAQRHGMAVGGRIAVLNVSAATYDTSIVAREGIDSFAVLRTEDGPGGALGFHDALHAYVRSHLTHADQAASAEDRHNIDADVERAVRAAMTTLSTDTEVTLHVGLPGQPPLDSIRVVRSEFEAVIRPSVVTMIDALHRTLVGAGTQPADVLATVIVGSGAIVPLVAQQVGAVLSCPVIVDDEPATSIATGAAVSAWFDAAAAAEQRAIAPDDEDEDEDGDDDDRRRVPLWAWWSRQRPARRTLALVPGGMLAALVIFGVLMASSMLSDADTGPTPSREGEPQVATTSSDSALTPTLPLTEAAPVPLPTPATGQAQPVGTTPSPSAAPSTTPRRSPTAGPTTSPTVGPTVAGPPVEEPADTPVPSTPAADPSVEPTTPTAPATPPTTVTTTPTSTSAEPTTTPPTSSTPVPPATDFAVARRGTLG